MWSWSYTDEGIEMIRSQIAARDRYWLEIVYAEWEGWTGDDNLSQKKYKRAKRHAKSLSDDALIEYIFDKAQENAICSNGGWSAWCCPFGCGCHELPVEWADSVKVKKYTVSVWGSGYGPMPEELDGLEEEEGKKKFAENCQQLQDQGWALSDPNDLEAKKRYFECSESVCLRVSRYTKEDAIQYVAIWYDLEYPKED